MNLTLSQISSATGATLQGDGDVRVSGVSIDSRSLEPGDLFFAIVDQRDGHDFIGAAVRAGAAALVVSREIPDPGIPCIVVGDTLEALQSLARHVRQSCSCTVVGLTGSCGKTTTRQLIAAALAGAGKVHQSRGNLNNHLGVPLTLLGLRSHHRFAVVEMGANHHGEIRSLTTIANPDVGLVTCVAEAHTEFFGSIEGVARAKSELFSTMRPDSTCVVNLDDPLVSSMDRGARPCVTYARAGGCDAGAGVQLVSTRHLQAGGQVIELQFEGATTEANIALSGDHNALNAAAAVAVAIACGVDPTLAASALSAVGPVRGRGAVVAGAHLEIIDDTYNANPASMEAALATLVQTARGRRSVAILGDMFELGDESAQHHRRVGRAAARFGVDRIVAVGPSGAHVIDGAVEAGASPSEATRHDTLDEVLDDLSSAVQDGALVLVKGSRGMKMERVVEMLLYW